ncbi:hypothetical protein MSAN_00766800 [Mycena sanguinolenta]|uniref:Uncharacterized protein n=1 Tax=Mycena sanguinolenta TaxID=230812 RepID=A0A8H7DFM0_9AGAR|nr:hypothetical protein MSAN_00766800 [Mycena sanguinolenta]
MYHRQAAGFIEKNRGPALSSDSLQVLSSYLGCKYVSYSTNLMVLRELHEKLRSSEESHRVMVDDPVGLQLVVEMLESPFPDIRRLTCTILGHLAVDKCTVLAALLNFGIKLVTLICDEDDKIVQIALRTLCVAVRSPSGAQAFIDAKLLDTLSELLKSPRPFVRMQACTLLEQLMVETSTAYTVVRNFEMKILPLIRDEDDKVAERAMQAFSAAVRFPPVSQAFIDTTLFDGILELLESSRPFVRTQAGRILGQFVVDTSTASTVVRKLGMKLPLLIRVEDDMVGANAMRVFSAAVRIPRGARAFVNAKLLDSVPELLESPRPFVRMQTCLLVAKLASHVQTRKAVLKWKPCPRLVVLLHDKGIYVIHAAVYALTQISRTPSGAKAVLNAKALEHVPRLLDPETIAQARSYTSTPNMVQARTNELLASLFRHEFAVPAILRLNICAHLVSILQAARPPPETWVYDSLEIDYTSPTVATALLARMSEWPSGVSAVADTAVLNAIEGIDWEIVLSVRTDMRTIQADVRTIQDNVTRYKNGNQK